MSEELTQTGWYDYKPIIHRDPLKLPDGARVAVVPYINIEHFPENIAGTALVPGTQGFSPDPLNYGWRDYGNRVGLWRMMEIMDSVGMRGTVCLNSDIIREYPQILDEGEKRKWAWIGHGINNAPANFLSGIEPDRERKIIGTVLELMEKRLGRKTKGWLSPFLVHTFNSPDIMAELGLEYLCDYTCDDQPFKFNTTKGSLIAVTGRTCGDAKVGIHGLQGYESRTRRRGSVSDTSLRNRYRQLAGDYGCAASNDVAYLARNSRRDDQIRLRSVFAEKTPPL